jgi:glyoxylase-like metal-dependent hydrolase (beta-lactamase superfamily II)
MKPMRPTLALLAFALAGSAATAAPVARGWHLVPGTFEPGRQPDGNSVFLDAPRGLILVDTGRHPAHQAELIAYARARGRPIAVVVNSHWHLDHSGGNAEIRAAFPRAPLYASRAVEGALAGFLPDSRRGAEAFLASGKAGPEQAAEIRGDFAAMDDPGALHPTRPVTRSGTMRLAGRKLQVNLARFAATEGDVWLYDPAARLVVAGDLVVGLVPFLDTACPQGWRKALDEIAARPFRTLVPGHGAPMDRPGFLAWRAAFNDFLDCAGSDRPRQACIDGWLHDAAAFIPAGDRDRVAGMAGYYLDTRLRAAPAERDKYCRPLH